MTEQIMRLFCQSLTWFLLGLLPVSLRAQIALQFTVTTIYPPPESQAYSMAGYALNDHGAVVGRYSRYANPQGQNQIRSFLYTDSRGSVDAWPEIWTSSATGINNAGQIAFYGGETYDNAQPYRYTPGVGYEWLGTFGGPYGQADAINGRGQVTGYSELADGRARAFRYTDGIGMEYVGGSLFRSRGYGINDLGWVVGTGDGAAFLYRDGIGTTILGAGWAYDVNNLGMVVGETVTEDATEAFLYRDGQMALLGNLGGGMASLRSINEQGIAVGVGFIPLGGGFLRATALYWSEATGLIDLNTLLPQNSGWYLPSATGINEHGQITGNGRFNGVGMAYRLDPIPEPSRWVLLGLGALMLGACRRRRKG